MVRKRSSSPKISAKISPPKVRITDIMNERGLVVGVLYLPGFAEFQPYDPAHAREGFKTFPWISKNHKKFRM
jgi:penicillin V acylase-like amidase (Ntn superfamily)